MDRTHILLGVSGGIAAYKAADLASLLTKSGYAVDVVMTANAQRFVSPLTFQTLTRSPVYTDSFAPIEDYSVEHISLAKRASLVVVAPATANVIAKAAHGIADDLLTTVLLAAWQKPCAVCPAMNTAMYENPVVTENIDILRKRGWHILEPGAGRLACGDEGKGRLPDASEIAAFIQGMLPLPHALPS